MSDNTNDGGAAFPAFKGLMTVDPHGVTSPIYEGGMSLRDYFAAKAMQGLMAVSTPVPWNELPVLHREQAIQAYQQADAMLAAREVKS